MEEPHNPSKMDNILERTRANLQAAIEIFRNLDDISDRDKVAYSIEHSSFAKYLEVSVTEKLLTAKQWQEFRSLITGFFKLAADYGNEFAETPLHAHLFVNKYLEGEFGEKYHAAFSEDNEEKISELCAKWPTKMCFLLWLDPLLAQEKSDPWKKHLVTHHFNALSASAKQRVYPLNEYVLALSCYEHKKYSEAKSKLVEVTSFYLKRFDQLTLWEKKNFGHAFFLLGKIHDKGKGGGEIQQAEAIRCYLNAFLYSQSAEVALRRSDISSYLIHGISWMDFIMECVKAFVENYESTLQLLCEKNPQKFYKTLMTHPFVTEKQREYWQKHLVQFYFDVLPHRSQHALRPIVEQQEHPAETLPPKKSFFQETKILFFGDSSDEETEREMVDMSSANQSIRNSNNTPNSSAG